MGSISATVERRMLVICSGGRAERSVMYPPSGPVSSSVTSLPYRVAGCCGRDIPLVSVRLIAASRLLVSATMPTTVAHGYPLCGLPTCRRLPMACCPGQECRAIGLVNDHHQRRVGAIVDGEGAAFEQRDAHRAEVITLRAREHGELQLPTGYGHTLDGVGRAWPTFRFLAGSW